MADSKQNEKKKPSGCGCLLTGLFLFVIISFVIIGFTKVRDLWKEYRAAHNPEIYLAEYIDDDTRFIYVHYDGIEADADAIPDDDYAYIEDEAGRREFIIHMLEREHVLSGITEAIENREEKICIIGTFSSGVNGYENDWSLGLDNGYIRMLPYSSFWVNSYSGSTGYLPAEEKDKDHTLGERYYVYTFNYFPMSEAEIREAKSLIDQEADDIISLVPEGADRWHTYKFIHDELCRRLDYNYELNGEHDHDLYGALVQHMTVCEGYALAFQFVLERMGYPCDVVLSDYDEEWDATHAWNHIHELSYDVYFDLTWDDTSYTDRDGRQIILYDYFGLTQEEMSSVDVHAFEPALTTYYEGEVETYNYHRHEGYMLSSYDEAAVKECFRKQYENGSNSLTVRFDNTEAYQAACAGLLDGGGMNEALTYAGYSGRYWWRSTDELCVIDVGLGELPEE